MKKTLLLATAFFLGLGCINLYAKTIDKTIAIVNGEAIMASEFNKIVEPVLEQYQKMAPTAEQSPEKIKEFKQKLLDQMIDDRLLKQEAKKKKIRVAKREIEQGVKQVRDRFETEAEFKQELKREKLTKKQFEKRIEEQLMVMKLIEKEIKKDSPPPEDKEIRKFFDQVVKKMDGKNLGLSEEKEKELESIAKLLSRASSEQVRAKHILIQVDKNASMSDKSKALNKIKKIHKQLKNGKDFDELAKEYSEDPGSKMRGGDLGYFAKGDMVPEFEKVAFKLGVGKYSDPVLTDFGYHIIKVEEKRAKRKVNYEDVKNDLAQLLYQKAAQEKYEKWLKNVRAKATIKINNIE